MVSSKDKKKGKEVPKAQEKSQSPQPQEPEIPSEIHSNPFIEIPHKRMRALKKRLIKIEKNEEAKANKVVLDADQIRSIEQKQEVVDIIRELEELIKHMSTVEIEEENKAKKLKKQQEQEEQKKIRETQLQSSREFKKSLELLFILNLFANEDVRRHFTTDKVAGFSLSAEELSNLDHIAFVLYGQYDPSSGLTSSSQAFNDRLLKLSAKSTESISGPFTYASAHDLLSRIAASSYFDPALAARIAEEKAAAEAAAEAARREQEELQRSYEIISRDDIPPPSHMSPEQMNGLPGGKPLAFMGESELLGMKPKLSFDGSPEVFVPIPLTLFENQTRPAFSFGSSTPSNIPAQTPTPTPAIETPAPQTQELAPITPAENFSLVESTPPRNQPHRGRGRGNHEGGYRGGYQDRNQSRGHNRSDQDNRGFARQTTNNHRDDGGFRRQGRGGPVSRTPRPDSGSN